jgi:hypothetical protein
VFTVISGLSPTSWAAIISIALSWGSATLHPRLYAVARYRGLEFRIQFEVFLQLNLDFLCKAVEFPIWTRDEAV